MEEFLGLIREMGLQLRPMGSAGMFSLISTLISGADLFLCRSHRGSSPNDCSVWLDGPVLVGSPEGSGGSCALRKVQGFCCNLDQICAVMPQLLGQFFQPLILIGRA